MYYAQIKDGVATELENALYEWDDKNYCTPAALVNDGKAEQFGVVPVVFAAQPAFDPVTQSITKIAPAQVDGDWTQQWQVTELSPEQVEANRENCRSLQRSRVKHERDRRKSLGVKVGDHWYHSDADSRTQQLSLFVMGAAVPPVQWKTLTTSPPPVFVTMTPAIATGIFQNTAASDAAIFAAAEAHRVAMEASSTPESYDMSSGWPASIEDEAL